MVAGWWLLARCGGPCRACLGRGSIFYDPVAETHGGTSETILSPFLLLLLPLLLLPLSSLSAVSPLCTDAGGRRQWGGWSLLGVLLGAVCWSGRVLSLASSPLLAMGPGVLCGSSAGRRAVCLALSLLGACCWGWQAGRRSGGCLSSICTNLAYKKQHNDENKCLYSQLFCVKTCVFHNKLTVFLTFT